MADLFFNKVTVEKFRCFAAQDFEFNVPNGTTPGSGLNIILGENGNGKTTLLEAINLLGQSSFTIENRIEITDFYDMKHPIKVRGRTDVFRCRMPYPGNYYEADGVESTVKCRDRKSPGRLLSSPFQANSSFCNTTPNYKNSRGADSGKPLKSLYTSFKNDDIDGGEFSIFFFDKNRSRQISTGTFSTTFQRICEDFNWRFAKEMDAATIPEMVKNVSGEYFTAVLDAVQKGVGTKLASDLSTFFGMMEYQKLKIDLVDLLHPFSQAFFALRDSSELKQIKTKGFGSGIEMILTILLLKSIAGESKGSIIYLIDEPELHLHPKAQDKFLELLLDESKNKQVIVTTHSPYIFKEALGSPARIIIMKKESSGNVVVEYPNTSGWGKFPWSPSWGEINFHAFEMPTVEFLNELFGYIQERNRIPTIVGVDGYLSSNGVALSKTWVKSSGGIAQPSQPCTLPYYVRNSIHHPENAFNLPYTKTELNVAIRELLPLA